MIRTHEALRIKIGKNRVTNKPNLCEGCRLHIDASICVYPAVKTLWNLR